MSADERVRDVVEPLLAAQGLELVDVEVIGPALKLTVDRDGGIDLEAITAATRAVTDALDHADPLPDRYTLEVTSPGIERPLRTPEHFKRVVGATVALKTRPGTEGERRVQGTLVTADHEGVVVAGRRLAYAEVERARTVFSWGPAPRPTGPAKGGKGQAKKKRKKKAASR